MKKKGTKDLPTENYYALYLCIVNGYSVNKALMTMKIRPRKNYPKSNKFKKGWNNGMA